MFSQLREDIQCILQRDPAARSRLEVLTCYPGLHAILIHRMAHGLWKRRLYWLARFCSHVGRMLTGLEIHPGAQIGRRVFFDHGFGVVVGETAVIGDDCTIYQGVTLGGTSLYKGTKRHPTLEAGVVVGAGAQILGGFTVGAGARIGSNAVVVKPVPAGATAVGNPARIISKRDISTPSTDEQLSAAPESAPTPHSPCQASDLQQSSLLELLKQSRTNNDITDKNIGSTAFEAYAVGAQANDPLTTVLHELITHTAQQDARIHRLCQALESLGQGIENGQTPLDVERLNKMVE
ncbi:serine O-acetyltransferase [Alcaligenes endophyticus]|uniref:serine O-acetyltransferase n=1 Tax=Alcaligenes endophyticus TaxID=1929088 RepID=A0ABT8EN39_9BURK|nr:serine O-acetyltransferase [Alcaligenes endophyticus]MCX5591451.1 serine O-acetyltransferase [Alcaligenes endophyticus]MDN4122668.1 serine O-acetyltransferase [Alcaligenes endophyticus]